jgi:hypothetical protein
MPVTIGASTAVQSPTPPCATPRSVTAAWATAAEFATAGHPRFNCAFGSDPSTGHGYWFCATKTKREPARRLCRDLGGDADFVIIDSAQENAMVADKISTDSYIGYSDALVVGTWIWVDGSKGSYTNWDTKQPGVEQFALMEKSNGKWKVTFENILLGFVCEGAKLKQP